jgi:ArsR family transcriptional regulator
MTGLAETTDLLRLLGDPTRLRLLALLAEEELSVAEITRVTELPQSRVSTHLGKLREAEVVRDRKAGASSFYALDEAAWPEGTRRLLDVVRDSAKDPVIEADRGRLRAVLQARNAREAWADAVAGSMERHYSPGRTWESALRALLGLLHLGDVLDIASGDGALAELCAPRTRSLTCLDSSAKVIAAARRRLVKLPNVRFAEGDMHALPFPDASFDQVLLLNALTHTRTPRKVVAEAARVLRPGGDLVGVTLKTHRHEAVAAEYDQVRLGFSPGELRGHLESAGLVPSLCEVTSREKRAPHFEVITLHAQKKDGGADRPAGGVWGGRGVRRERSDRKSGVTPRAPQAQERKKRKAAP